MIDGTVTAISADSVADAPNLAPYFKVDVRLDARQVAELQNVRITPGMPAQVMIATGEQTLANYLLSPVLGNFEQAVLENE
jgi:epimerase transport system membrane fusion protein